MPGGGGITVRELITKLGWDVDEATIKRFDRAVGTAKVGLLAITGAAVAAGAALIGVAISAANAGEEALATAELVGLSVEEFQKYRHAASLAEVSNEEFTTSLRFLTRNVGDAIRGQGEVGKTFAKLGITLKDANGNTRDTGSILRDVADRFQGIKDPATRASLSMDLFGRGGARMGRFLMQGSAGLEAASAAVSTFGLFTEATAKEADAMGDSLQNLKGLAFGLRNELGIRLFKSIRDISERMQKWLIANEAVIKQKLDKFVEGLTKALGYLLLIGEKVGAFFVWAIERLGGFDNAVKLVLFGVTALTIGFAALAVVALIAWGEILILPALIAAGIFLVILVLEDLYVWMQGGQSVIGGWLDNFQSVKKVLDGVASVIAGFLTFIVGLFTADGNLIIAATDEMIKGILNVLTSTASLIAKAIAYPFQLGFELIKKVIPDWAVKFLTGGFNTGGFGQLPAGISGGPSLAGAGLSGGFNAGAFARPSVVNGASNSTSATATVNNYVTVPPGTPGQQVDAIRSAVGQVVDEHLRRSFDHVNQENPQVD